MKWIVPTRWAPYLSSVLRIVAAFTYVLHGTQKLLGFPAAQPPRPTVAIGSLAGTAGILEMVGGILLFTGLFTKPVAFLLAGEMAYAYLTVHAPRSFWPLVNLGELAVLYCFIWLYFAGAGGGPLSLDALVARGRHGSPHGDPYGSKHTGPGRSNRTD
jgi:putative oxidoreductase